MDIERMLGEIDFSSCSKVKNSLWERISGEWQHSKELGLDDLDMVAAAGNAFINPSIKSDNK